MFFLGFSGLPRRVHDFPAIMLGWQGMATSGHFLTIVGLIFFFITLLSARVDALYYLDSALSIQRWQKRSHYYLFKIK